MLVDLVWGIEVTVRQSLWGVSSRKERNGRSVTPARAPTGKPHYLLLWINDDQDIWHQMTSSDYKYNRDTTQSHTKPSKYDSDCVTSHLFAFPTPLPHQNSILLISPDGAFQLLQNHRDAAILVHKTSNVVDHGSFARFTGTAVNFTETITLKEAPERDVITTIKIHTDDPGRNHTKYIVEPF